MMAGLVQYIMGRHNFNDQVSSFMSVSPHDDLTNSPKEKKQRKPMVAHTVNQLCPEDKAAMHRPTRTIKHTLCSSPISVAQTSRNFWRLSGIFLVLCSGSRNMHMRSTCKLGSRMFFYNTIHRINTIKLVITDLGKVKKVLQIFVFNVVSYDGAM